MTNKTPEEMAEEWANNRCPEQGPEFIVWCMCKEDFLAGYKAAQDQLADAYKVMDTCEHILDMEKMVDVNPSNNSNGWISVKDRLPDVLQGVLVLYAPTNKVKNDYRMECWNWPETEVWESQFVTHWMPLPEAPKE